MTRTELLELAEKAGLVRFEGGELSAYGSIKPSADDQSKAFWSVAAEEKLLKFADLVLAKKKKKQASH